MEYDVKPRNNNRQLRSSLIPQENPQGVAGMQKTKILQHRGHHLQQKCQFSEWLLTSTPLGRCCIPCCVIYVPQQYFALLFVSFDAHGFHCLPVYLGRHPQAPCKYFDKKCDLSYQGLRFKRTFMGSGSGGDGPGRCLEALTALRVPTDLVRCTRSRGNLGGCSSKLQEVLRTFCVPTAKLGHAGGRETIGKRKHCRGVQ